MTAFADLTAVMEAAEALRAALAAIQGADGWHPYSADVGPRSIHLQGLGRVAPDLSFSDDLGNGYTHTDMGSARLCGVVKP